MESIIPERRDFEFEDIDGPAAGDAPATGSARKDYFVELDGQVFAGLHLIIDLWNSAHLDEPDYIETALIRAATAAGATVLNADFHVFSPNNGVSGVLVLAESHISIHTWPERGYAAVDVFMCGACDPKDTIETLKVAFAPSNMGIQEIRRGLTT